MGTSEGKGLLGAALLTSVIGPGTRGCIEWEILLKIEALITLIITVIFFVSLFEPLRIVSSSTFLRMQFTIFFLSFLPFFAPRCGYVSVRW